MRSEEGKQIHYYRTETSQSMLLSGFMVLFQKGSVTLLCPFFYTGRNCKGNFSSHLQFQRTCSPPNSIRWCFYDRLKLF